MWGIKGSLESRCGQLEDRVGYEVPKWLSEKELRLKGNETAAATPQPPTILSLESVHMVARANIG